MATKKQILIRLGEHVRDAVRKLEIRAYQALTSATPVDTGFARAGWSPSTGSPAPGPAGPPSSRDAAVVQAQSLFGMHDRMAKSIAGGYVLSQGTVFIVNNVRYITFLNNPGTSAQAPAMFVEQAVRQAVAAVKREL